jgi:hypothetical protein
MRLEACLVGVGRELRVRGDSFMHLKAFFTPWYSSVV